jgi:hypothetical protein
MAEFSPTVVHNTSHLPHGESENFPCPQSLDRRASAAGDGPGPGALAIDLVRPRRRMGKRPSPAWTEKIMPPTLEVGGKPMNRSGVEGSTMSTNGRKRPAALNTTPKDHARESTQAALDHAWSWFALHARQRMHCVNFFLVAVAFLATGYVTALTKDLYGPASGIGVLGAWISFWFHRLDLRTKELVKAGEAAMKPLQQSLAQATGTGELEILKRVDAPGREWTSYGDVLRVLHWTTLFAFVVGAFYAVYLAGVRLCLAV